MANEGLAVFNKAGLPSVRDVVAHMRKVDVEIGSGNAILKLDKSGTWIYGAEEVEVQEGSQWAVDPLSFTHGFIAWGEGEVLGEKMVPIYQDLPATGEAPDGARKGWEMQVGAFLKCLTGDDTGLIVTYNTTSYGGKRAIQTLLKAIADQVDEDEAKPVPVVLLKSDSYKHKQYGKVFNPLIEVVKWVSLEPKGKPALPAPEPEEEDEEPAPEPKRTRRAVVEEPAPEPKRTRRAVVEETAPEVEDFPVEEDDDTSFDGAMPETEVEAPVSGRRRRRAIVG